ncbi:type II secretion system protein [Lentilactobacillus otakiensis]|uniref:type II secretion system protein n=1 Tax=Lentilactobacillus otakiensis TaxID=481720 RepID=UPI003D168839
MKSKSRDAFTVIELIVYLGVIIGILMINLMLIKVVQTGNPSERIFWNSFQSAWTRMTLNAKANNVSYRISIRNKDIVFFPMETRLSSNFDEVHTERISVPDSIHVRSSRHLIADDDGFSAPTTIVWLDKENDIKYYQKVQMGWSGYHVERK